MRAARTPSNPQIPMLQLRLRDQLLRGAAPYRAAALDDVVAVGDAGEVLDVLVDDQHLLLAARQRGAHIAGSFSEPRKQRVDLTQGPRLGIAETIAGRGDQVL